MPDLLTWFSDPTRRRPLLRLLVAAQVLYVLGVAGAGYATTALGKHIVLATTPVDVRDLQRGDFVRLRYTISEQPLGLWRGPEAPRRRQSVFVLLTPGTDSLSTTVGVFPQAPAAAPAQAVLRAWVTDVYRTSFTVRFNLERYYVPEASAMRLPRALRQPPSLRVRVSIAPWGQARITSVSEVNSRARPSRP